MKGHLRLIKGGKPAQKNGMTKAERFDLMDKTDELFILGKGDDIRRLARLVKRIHKQQFAG